MNMQKNIILTQLLHFTSGGIIPRLLLVGSDLNTEHRRKGVLTAKFAVDYIAQQDRR